MSGLYLEEAPSELHRGSGRHGIPGPTPYERVESVWMEAAANDGNFAPPALTNQWAMLATGWDVFSYEGFAAPPYFHQERQAQVYLAVGSGPLRRMGAMGTVVRHHWRLDRVERWAIVGGIALETTTAISAYQPAVLQRLRITNTTDDRKQLRLLVVIDSNVATTDWIFDPGYESRAPRAYYDRERGEWLFASEKGDAWAAVVTDPVPASVDGLGRGRSGHGGSSRGGGSAEGKGQGQAAEARGERVEDDSVEHSIDPGALPSEVCVDELSGEIPSPCLLARALYIWTLAPHETVTLQWVHALAGDRETAAELARRHLKTFDERLEEARAEWEEEWRAAFTPGNERFSGHMPALQTDDERLRRMYDMAVATVLYCKRTVKRGMGDKGFVYATGLPSTRFTFRVTSAFLWDVKMIAGMLAMLDPGVLRSMMEMWIEAGIHKGYGVDFVTREPLGFWYAVNDHALIHMAWQYVRYTGDWAWLSKEVAGKPVKDHLVTSARYWRRLAGDDLLADYGGAENLLECVSTYTHKVASFNAANVWNMRTVASLLEQLGETEEPRRLRDEADQLARQVLTLYIPKEGYWACKQPDGRLVPVRHVLDFFSVMLNMTVDLTREQKDEMVAFFKRELKEPSWMHALSPLDPDTAFSDRTDHQDNGAYTTWPAYCIEALVEAGYIRDAFDWLGVGRTGPGIADVALQGPYGQAYHHGGEGSPMVAGAAAKAPLDPPHIEKPVLVSGGKYAQIVIEYLAGVTPGLDGRVTQRETARCSPVAFTLRNIPIQGKLYRVDVTPGGSGGAAV